MRTRAGAVAAVACLLTMALALALGGCGAAEPDPMPSVPAGVSVALEQLRSDVAARQVQARVTNGSDSAITVGGVRIDDDRFDGPSRRVVADRVSTVPAGSSVDIRVQLAPVDCSAPDEGAARVVLELVSDSGTTEVAASAPDPLGFLERLHARECLAERLSDAATLAFTGFAASPGGEAATLELSVAPTGDSAATLVGVERTNLIDFAGLGEDALFPLHIDVADGDTAPVVVDLPIVPARCDPHVVQEDKRGTVFDVRIEIEDEQGEIELYVGDDLRGRILSWVGAWCGFGTAG